jgi:hypothetical protein
MVRSWLSNRQLVLRVQYCGMQWRTTVHVLRMLLLLRKGLRAAARVPATAVQGRLRAACYVYFLFLYLHINTPSQSSCRDAGWRMAARKLATAVRRQMIGTKAMLKTETDTCSQAIKGSA